MRRLFLHLALSLLLISAQQAAIAHITAHAAQHVSHHEPLHDGTKACEKCLGMAHLGDAVGTAAQVVLARLPLPALPVAAAIATHNSELHAYRSRAPPKVL